jgi:hypothetical protein
MQIIREIYSKSGEKKSCAVNVGVRIERVGKYYLKMKIQITGPEFTAKLDKLLLYVFEGIYHRFPVTMYPCIRYRYRANV